MVISTVPLFHAMSVWAVALEREFGWNRTQLGFALTFTRVEGGLMGPLEGYLTDKVGTRRMVFIGLLILGGAFIFFGQVQNLWMFYLAYILMAVGQGLGSWIPLMTMLTRWFKRRRTMAIGWSNMGSRAGALLLVPLIAWSIDPDHDANQHTSERAGSRQAHDETPWDFLRNRSSNDIHDKETVPLPAMRDF